MRVGGIRFLSLSPFWSFLVCLVKQHIEQRRSSDGGATALVTGSVRMAPLVWVEEEEEEVHASLGSASGGRGVAQAV